MDSSSRSASGWSPRAGGCGAGTGSSPKAPARRRPSDCCAPIATPSWPAHLPALEQGVADATGARDLALAAMEQGRQRCRGRPPGRTRRREGQPRRRPRRRFRRSPRSSGSTRSGRTSPSGSSTWNPCSEASRDALTAAEAALAHLPDPAALEAQLDEARSAAATASSAVADKRAEAATRARETAADRDRLATGEREQGEWRGRQKDAAERLKLASERQAQLADERRELEGQPAELDTAIRALEQDNDQSRVRVGEASAAEGEAERAVVAAADDIADRNERSADARERRAAATARAEAQQARSHELARSSVEKFEVIPQRLPEMLGFDGGEPRIADEEARTLERLTLERERIGPVNLVAESELAELDEARSKGAEEAEELTQAIHRLRGSIGNLNREGRVRLLEAYERVDTHFRRLFTTLFDGGQAHLELVESDDPLEAGLEIMAQPPGKRLSTLTLLSGGEQALTAIALIFAIFLTNPAPICVLDEVDAPLDDANVERFCELLIKMTRRDRHPLPDRHS